MSLFVVIALIVGIYFGMMPLIYIWDAKFGWGEDPDDEMTASPDMGDLLWWPVILATLPFYLLSKWAESAKAKRLQRAQERKRLYVAVENERRIALMNLEKELHDAREDQNYSESSRRVTSTSIRA